AHRPPRQMTHITERQVRRINVADIDYHRAHESYIGAVVDALRAAGIAVADWLADPNDPRDGAIQLGEPGDDDDFAEEKWIGWDEQSGWMYGVDKDGRSGLSGIRWAQLDVLPEPEAVVAWVREVLPRQMQWSEMDRPQYRGFEDE